MSDVTSEGDRLIRNWLRAAERVHQCKLELNTAECDLINAGEALAKWMKPPDAKPGEKIAVWFGDSLIQVEVGGVPRGETVNGVGPAPTETSVTVRYRGKHFNELRN